MSFSFSFRPDRYKNTGHVFFLYRCIKTNMNFYGRVQKNSRYFHVGIIRAGKGFVTW